MTESEGVANLNFGKMGGNSLFSGLPAPAPLPSDPVDPSLIRPEPVPPGPSILASAASAKRAAEKSGKEGN